MIRPVLAAAHKLRTASDADLAARADGLRDLALADDRRFLRRAAVPGFALVLEAVRRQCGFTLHPVQVRGGLAVLAGNVAEMATGEGKTLTALAPLFVRSLAGRGTHAVTVNDYLADRDAALAGAVLGRLGVTVDRVANDTPTADRRRAYAADVTYGTEKEFGFDHLRDRLRAEARRSSEAGSGAAKGGRAVERPVQRGLHFALVDEADSLLIDQARTPLVIGTGIPPGPADRTLYAWADRLAGTLAEGEDFRRFGESAASLSSAGVRRVLLAARPPLLADADAERLLTGVEQALGVRAGIAADREFVVRDGTVEIVDPSTGRVLGGRKWQSGLHQAVEVAAGLEATDRVETAARVTVCDFFRRYRRLAGMTGTARSVRRELRAAYRLGVVRIPTHRPCRRVVSPTRVFGTAAAKLSAVAAEADALRRGGRAVLVGTASVRGGEAASAALAAAGVPHALLHARHHAREAEIVAAAGGLDEDGRGRVTVATNMAGRGTDITLAESVRAAGGLQVLATELNAAARIDRQLAGRAARQGDPGGVRTFLSAEDELLADSPPRRLPPPHRERITRPLAPPLPHRPTPPRTPPRPRPRHDARRRTHTLRLLPRSRS